MRVSSHYSIKQPCFACIAAARAVFIHHDAFLPVFELRQSLLQQVNELRTIGQLYNAASPVYAHIAFVQSLNKYPRAQRNVWAACRADTLPSAPRLAHEHRNTFAIFPVCWIAIRSTKGWPIISQAHDKLRLVCAAQPDIRCRRYLRCGRRRVRRMGHGRGQRMGHSRGCCCSRRDGRGRVMYKGHERTG